MLSVKMAQGLRVDLKDLQDELKQLKQNHAVAKTNKDRAGMVQLTKHINSHEERINRINEALKDAPVEPWEPEQVWLAIVSSFHYVKDFEKDKAGFLEDISKDIGYTLEWKTAGIVQSEKKAHLTKWVDGLVEKFEPAERVEKFYEYLPKFIEQLQGEVLRGARRQTSMSTSESSNLVERARLEATADLLDNLTNWGGFGINRAKEHFESWKELNKG